MDNQLFGLVGEVTEKFNQLILDGVAVEHMKRVESFVDQRWRQAAKGFPGSLKYLGYQQCTPYEEFGVITRRGVKPTFDIAENSLYMVEYQFSFQMTPTSPKELLRRHMYLPFCKDAGLMAIRGSTFAVSPVLADTALSVGDNSIFIPLECAKLTFERTEFNFKINGERETVDVVHSEIYNRNPKSVGGKPKITPNHTMVHYLLCKYGLSQMFQIFTGAHVIVGTSEDCTEERYPPEEWVICSSTRLKPKEVRTKIYVASDVRLVISREQYTPETATLIGGFFYLVDHFPQRVEPEFVNHIRLWRVLLGHVIWGGEGGEGKMMVDVNLHMESLDEYMDEQSQQRLQQSGVHCQDIYEFFYHIIQTFAERVMQTDDAEASMYGKELMVLRYLLSDISSAIYRFKFALRRHGDKVVTLNDVTGAMQKCLNQDAITKINRDHGEVSGVSSPGDNKYFKITSNLVPQTSATGSSRGKSKSSLTDPAKQLHVSIAEFGSYTNLPKSNPDGKTRLPPTAETDPTATVLLRDETKREFYDAVQQKFKR